MSALETLQKLVDSQPPTSAAAGSWAPWTASFLETFAQTWADWKKTWTVHEEPYYQLGNPDAWFITDRVTRQTGFVERLVTGVAPQAISSAASRLKELSAAVQRFSNTGSWNFQSREEADEVANWLLTIGQDIERARHTRVSEDRLDKLSRQIRLAMNRLGGGAGSVCRSDLRSPSLTKAVDSKPRRPGRPGKPPISKKEAARRDELIETWKKAKGQGISQKEFCLDHGLQLAYLTRCMNWAAQRRQRDHAS